jgi:ribosomal protein S6--L-glutamate ligase
VRFAILSRNKKLHSIRRLLAEAKRLGIVCDVIDPLECQVLVDHKNSTLLYNGKPLPAYDAILPRIGTSITDYGLAVVKQFELLGSYTVNSSEGIQQSRDKLRSLQILSHAGIRVPPTVLASHGKNLKPTVQTLGGMPVVLKVLKGTQGVGVMIVNSPNSLTSVMDTLHTLDQDIILQQFIKEGAGEDFRAFVVGKQVVASMKRTAPRGEFRSNIHRGGEGTPVKLPISYQRIAIQCAQTLGLSIAGVDIMQDSRGALILEVNSSPGFEGIEKATGKNVAQIMIQYMQKQARLQSKRKKPRKSLKA